MNTEEVVAKEHTEEVSVLPSNIVLYDGDCAFCNRWVLWLLERDSRRQLYYASQQGDFAKRLIEEGIVSQRQIDDLSTILFVQKIDSDYSISIYSTAILSIVAKLEGIYALGLPLLLVPKSIRDGVYRWVAKNRYRWFGKHDPDACRLLTAEEKLMVLD